MNLTIHHLTHKTFPLSFSLPITIINKYLIKKTKYGYNNNFYLTQNHVYVNENEIFKLNAINFVKAHEYGLEKDISTIFNMIVLISLNYKFIIMMINIFKI